MTTVTFAGLGPTVAPGAMHATLAPASTPPGQQTPDNSGAAVGLSLSLGLTALAIGVALKMFGKTTWVAAFVWVVVGATCATIAGTATGLFSSGVAAVNDSAHNAGTTGTTGPSAAAGR